MADGAHGEPLSGKGEALALSCSGVEWFVLCLVYWGWVWVSRRRSSRYPSCSVSSWNRASRPLHRRSPYTNRSSCICNKPQFFRLPRSSLKPVDIRVLVLVLRAIRAKHALRSLRTLRNLRAKRVFRAIRATRATNKCG